MGRRPERERLSGPKRCVRWAMPASSVAMLWSATRLPGSDPAGGETVGWAGGRDRLGTVRAVLGKPATGALGMAAGAPAGVAGGTAAAADGAAGGVIDGAAGGVAGGG